MPTEITLLLLPSLNLEIPDLPFASKVARYQRYSTLVTVIAVPLMPKNSEVIRLFNQFMVFAVGRHHRRLIVYKPDPDGSG